MQELLQIEARDYRDDILAMVIAPLVAFLYRASKPNDKWRQTEIKELMDDIAFFLSQIKLLMQPNAHDIGFFFYNALPAQELCDVPSMLAAGMTAFLVQINALYCAPDKGSKPERRSAYLISPTLAEEIEGRQLFYTRNREENGSAPHYRLKVISVPAKRLFKSDICPILAHEAAHYSGSLLRKRVARGHYFVETISELIANKLTDEWDERFTAIIKKEINLPDEEHYYYLAEFCDHVIYDLQTCMLQTRRYADLREEFENAFKQKHEKNGITDVSGAVEKDMSLFETSVRYLLTRSRRVEGIERIVQRVSSLFSECYADTLMIHVLGLNVDEYINYHLGAYVKLENGVYNYDQIDRMLAVMMAMGWFKEKEPVIYGREAQALLIEIRSEYNNFYVQKNIERLLVYLKECIKGFNKHFSKIGRNGKRLRLLQDVYMNFKNNRLEELIKCFQELEEMLIEYNERFISWLKV